MSSQNYYKKPCFILLCDGRGRKEKNFQIHFFFVDLLYFCSRNQLEVFLLQAMFFLSPTSNQDLKHDDGFFAVNEN